MYQIELDHDQMTEACINFLKECYVDAVDYGIERKVTDGIINVLKYLTTEDRHSKIMEELLIATDGKLERGINIV